MRYKTAMTFQTLLLLTLLLIPGPSLAGQWLEPREAVGFIDGVEVRGEVRVYLPTGYHVRASLPLVLALHGWDHDPALFQDRGELGPLADHYGFLVAIPATGRSIFETSFYRQTKRKRLTGAPGLRWVGEVVLPWLRANFEVSGDKRHTAVIGYSTGGRGAFLLAQRYPELGFIGSVSGTYDLMALSPKTGEYRIHEAIYGPRARFPERWEKDNVMSPELLAKLAGLHLHVAHGDKDKVVPIAQMRRFDEALREVPVASKWFVTTSGGGHDWALWNTHWPAMFAAFARSMR